MPQVTKSIRSAYTEFDVCHDPYFSIINLKREHWKSHLLIKHPFGVWDGEWDMCYEGDEIEQVLKNISRDDLRRKLMGDDEEPAAFAHFWDNVWPSFIRALAGPDLPELLDFDPNSLNKWTGGLWIVGCRKNENHEAQPHPDDPDFWAVYLMQEGEQSTPNVLWRDAVFFETRSQAERFAAFLRPIRPERQKSKELRFGIFYKPNYQNAVGGKDDLEVRGCYLNPKGRVVSDIEMRCPEFYGVYARQFDNGGDEQEAGTYWLPIVYFATKEEAASFGNFLLPNDEIA